MKRFRVGIVTMEATPWELEDNFQRMEEYVREAARRRAHLVIAPEGILDGYVCGADPNVTEEGMVGIAQRIPDGPYLKRAAARWPRSWGYFSSSASWSGTARSCSTRARCSTPTARS